MLFLIVFLFFFPIKYVTATDIGLRFRPEDMILANPNQVLLGTAYNILTYRGHFNSITRLVFDNRSQRFLGRLHMRIMI